MSTPQVEVLDPLLQELLALQLQGNVNLLVEQLRTANPEGIFIPLQPIFLNQSRWKTYQDCDRLYGWENIENLIPARPRKNLIIGSAVHKAQVHIHSKSSAPDAIAEGVTIAEDYLKKNMTHEGPILPGDEAEILAATSIIKNLLPEYYRHWGQLGQVWKPLGMELAFCVEVGEGTNVWLVGTIDNLASLNGRLWLVDYKTMAKLDMREFLKYEIDIQLTAYLYGATKQLSLDAAKQGKPPVIVQGAIIDGMVKTQVPQFHRELYTRTIEEFRDFELEFCMKAWEIASKHAIVRGDKSLYNVYKDKMYDLGQVGWKVAFPKNTQQCFRYGTCSHRDLCVTDSPTRRLSFKLRTPDYVDDAAAGRPLRTEKP